MCDVPAHDSDRAARAQRIAAGPDEISRRSALGLGGAALAALGLVSFASDNAPRAQAQTGPLPAEDLRFMVIVCDGMRAEELNANQTPTLWRWATQGTRYTNASAHMIAETLPNHTAMVTGVYPDRNGVPANSIWDHDARAERTMDRATDITYPTMLERVRTERGLTTASVLSKDYLFTIMHGKASVQWTPGPLLPITDHALDHFTLEAVKVTLADHDPRYTFVNLGDIDRFGHMDLSGTSLRLARNQALANTDYMLWGLEQYMRSTGVWDRTAILVLADHGMDWSNPLNLISAQSTLDQDPVLRGRFGIAQNGGANIFTYIGEPAERAAAVDRLRKVLPTLPGVNRLYAPAELHLGARGGDVVATCHPGWRFSDPTPLSNPIPGNHGHEVTLGIPFFICGGHPAVRRGQVVERAVTTRDAAATAAHVFGLSWQDMDAQPAREAFTL